MKLIRTAIAYVAAPILTNLLISSIIFVFSPFLGASIFALSWLFVIPVMFSAGIIGHLILWKFNATGKWHYIISAAVVGSLMPIFLHFTDNTVTDVTSFISKLEEHRAFIVLVEVWSIILGWIFWCIARPDRP